MSTDVLSESTATLLARSRDGDAAARERLVARYLPMLRRWAHGRLPASARDLNDTADLVQLTLLSALDRLDRFEPRREGAFLAYLRTTLLNHVRQDLLRGHRHGGPADAFDERVHHADDGDANAGALAELIDYEAALSRLTPLRREALILRLEFGMSFAEIAAALERPSAAAAHALVSRAVVDLARALG